jgi:transcriptional regulator with XRE-family HTH domain
MSMRFQGSQHARACEPSDVEVGGRLRERRRAAGLTQSVVAEHAGITFQQLQKYEKGTNRVSIGRLHSIAAALGVPATFFFDEPAKAVQTGSDKSHAFLARPEILRIAQAFDRLKSPELRNAFVEITRSLANRKAQTTKRRRPR